MKHLLASTLLTLFALGASASPTDPFIGDHGKPVKWEVSPSPGAAPVTLNGTVEQVYAKLLEINPNYDADWAGVDEDEDRKHLTCEAYLDAYQWHIKQGIKYLRKVKGKPSHGPGECGRVSCSGNSGIWWCNVDAKHTKVLPSYNNIADGAQVILDNCKSAGDGVRGQLGHDDRWTVVVQMAKC
ncbi:hypothetical protein BJY00DRAFT_301978 [Aspergillus carlsbadensis]|nr:hypothetical protein BJY00DRAFT_301978 [Aspergillus carlsbadensis]